MTPGRSWSPRSFDVLGECEDRCIRSHRIDHSLRGILLTAYAWWTVGTIAEIVGWVLLGVGLLMALLSFLGRHGHTDEVRTTDRAVPTTETGATARTVS